MDIEKEFRVAAAQADVWEFITSAEKIATCIPGVEKVEIRSPGKYTGVMTIKVGPIKTSVKADVDELEQNSPEYASYSIKGEEGGRASRMNADAKLYLSGVAADQTDVRFTSNVVIVGRLGKFAGGVMNKLADSIADQFIKEFRSQLEPQSEVSIAVPKQGLWARFMGYLRGLFGGS
jgi:carbon monoxide dehydrogenase subunit G